MYYTVMVIKGLRKLTLLDFPDKVACIVYTGGCNFRCPFCQNAVLVEGGGEYLSNEEFFAFLKERKGRLDGVCITGGEPLIQKGIAEFAEACKYLGYAVKTDTNGYMPDVLEDMLKRKCLDYVAMDVKNSAPKYALTAGLPGLDISRINRSIDLIRNSGVDYEFRTTVVKEFHEESDFREIGKMLEGAKRCYLQKFRDEGGTLREGLHAPSDAEMSKYAKILSAYVAEVNIR